MCSNGVLVADAGRTRGGCPGSGLPRLSRIVKFLLLCPLLSLWVSLPSFLLKLIWYHSSRLHSFPCLTLILSEPPRCPQDRAQDPRLGIQGPRRYPFQSCCLLLHCLAVLCPVLYLDWTVWTAFSFPPHVSLLLSLPGALSPPFPPAHSAPGSRPGVSRFGHVFCSAVAQGCVSPLILWVATVSISVWTLTAPLGQDLGWDPNIAQHRAWHRGDISDLGLQARSQELWRMASHRVTGGEESGVRPRVGGGCED